MGRRGTKPTPTAMLKLRGSWRGDINKNEPQLESEIPECPKDVKGVARDCWDELSVILNDMGVLTIADKTALHLLCETFAHWKRAQKMLEKHGDVYPIRDNNGDVKYLQQSPYVAISRNFGKALKDMLCEFGLTPSARSRVVTNTDKQTEQADARMKYLSE
jgi:P27 family predicted phage terminase small subunit